MMKTVKFIIYLLLLAIAAFALYGCSEYLVGGENEFSGGERLTYQDAEQLKNNMVGLSSTVIDPVNHTYYWSESGNKIHIFENCGSLKNSKNTVFGDYATAALNNKTEFCGSCLRKAGMTQEEIVFAINESGGNTTHQIHLTYDHICYVMNGSNTVHFIENCDSLSSAASNNLTRICLMDISENRELYSLCNKCLIKAGFEEDTDINRLCVIVEHEANNH